MDISIVGFRLTFNFSGLELERQRQQKLYNYNQQVQGCHYFLNSAEDINKVYMTADDDRVRCHDCILLNDEIGSTRYQVEIIEYYGDSPTLWTALLVKC